MIEEALQSKMKLQGLHLPLFYQYPTQTTSTPSSNIILTSGVPVAKFVELSRPQFSRLPSRRRAPNALKIPWSAYGAPILFSKHDHGQQEPWEAQKKQHIYCEGSMNRPEQHQDFADPGRHWQVRHWLPHSHTSSLGCQPEWRPSQLTAACQAVRPTEPLLSAC